ncbi:MAG: hypothetical protein ACKESC_01305 [Candidatus Hodgkinia cicadicola]
MKKENRLILYIWYTRQSLYAQIIDNQIGEIITSAHSTRNEQEKLAAKLALRCLAVGVFFLRFKGKYKGGIVRIIDLLNKFGIVI